MKQKISALLLEFNGAGTFKNVFQDTVQLGILGRGSEQRLANLAYVEGWGSALMASPLLRVTVCNTNNLVDFFQQLRNIRQYELIFIGHGAVHNRILPLTVSRFLKRRGKMIVFGSNEYTRMAEKIQFIRKTKADYVSSQLPIDAAQWLYQECTDTKVLSMPHALNHRLFKPSPSIARTIDIGFRGDFYHRIIGDLERTNILRFFQERGREFGLICDINSGRIPGQDWARFLSTCKAIVGAEAGTYYLQRNSEAVDRAKSYIVKHPMAAYDEVFNKFFKNACDIFSGKCVTSRHFEPIGTKTCQILIEGRYNDILAADQHYISVRKDLSNIEDAIVQYRDEGYRNEMVERTYEYVLSEHTYDHRVRALLEVVLK